MQYATPVNNVLFLARLEILGKAGCAVHYFQFKGDSVLIFVSELEPLISQTAKLLNCCRVLV